MKKDRNTSKMVRWTWVCAAAFLLIYAQPAMRADRVLASDGTQAGTEQETDESGQESFIGLLSEDQEKLLEEMLKRLEDGELSTQEQIDAAISDAEKELNITLTEKQKEQISKLVLRANELGLDREDILNRAQELYERYGSRIMENAEDAVRENILEPAKEAAVTETKNTFREFFRDMGETVKNFVKNLFG
ncbi:MAG TPA: DUF1002 domain-containing protein [Candidatus Eisenbergiella merdipullorum]|uniref:DUF1002 domain-containing protein n=1 Tax=Candidatus Eisenbergiella merdipullorum TaxID=2838553 RepID=A0A9D2IB14_9FIRM|nr:DUF1002 domain-containing protein [Candidatus Eisenbergiella merdipullorum]